MCGRFLLATRPDIVTETFGAAFPADYSLPRYNVAPGQDFPVLSLMDRKRFLTARWGLHFTQSTSPIINIRSESLFRKKGWQESLQNKRCMIPASGFYEWPQSQKRPYHVSPETQNTLIALAGIIQFVPLSKKYHFAIITVESPTSFRWLHHRFPLILSPERALLWLNPDLDLEAILATIEERQNLPPLKAESASFKVNNPKNDSPDLLFPDGEQLDIF